LCKCANANIYTPKSNTHSRNLVFWQFPFKHNTTIDCVGKAPFFQIFLSAAITSALFYPEFELELISDDKRTGASCRKSSLSNRETFSRKFASKSSISYTRKIIIYIQDVTKEKVLLLIEFLLRF